MLLKIHSQSWPCYNLWGPRVPYQANQYLNTRVASKLTPELKAELVSERLMDGGSGLVVPELLARLVHPLPRATGGVTGPVRGLVKLDHAIVLGVRARQFLHKILSAG